jgi:molybdenum cofactor cytidylyltransferase
MQLRNALRIPQNTVMAFVGAGGKTTAMFLVARELSTGNDLNTPRKIVLATTTTHLGAWQSGLADQVFCVNSLNEISTLEKNFPTGVTLLIGDETNDRLSGLSSANLEKVRRIADARNIPLLVEADGAHSCPLKAPGKHEPAIPEFSKHVVVVAGLSGIGKQLSREWVHRPEIFADLSGLTIGDEITLDAMVKVLRNKDGGLKNIPIAAHRVLLLNQADSVSLRAQGRSISYKLLNDYPLSIISSLGKPNSIGTQNSDNTAGNQVAISAVIEKIAGIILAAGGSTRFGEPKQLLLWKGEPLIRHVVIAAVNAGLSPVLVVVGSSGQEIEKVISDLPVRIVKNDVWMTGVSSSIRVGVSALPHDIGGVIFLQSDQPQVSQMLIKKIVESHQGTLAPITAPQIDGKRGNPVLFDINTFADLQSINGDMGGRALFSHYPIQWVIWHDPNQLLDIDTPADYLKFLDMYIDREETA